MSKNFTQYLQNNILNLSNTKNICFESLKDFIIAHSEIKHINFADCGIWIFEGKKNDVFLNSLCFINEIRSLDMSYNPIKDFGFYYLVKDFLGRDLIEQNSLKLMQSLNFNSCKIGNGLTLLTYLLKICPNLVELNLSNNDLIDNQMKYLIGSWDTKLLLSCKVLNLSDNKFTATSIIALLKTILKQTGQLEELSISCDNIMQNELEEFLPTLPFNLQISSMANNLNKDHSENLLGEENHYDNYYPA